MQPGAKFEEHCSNISRDILDLAVKCISETIYDDTAFLICPNSNTKMSISLQRKKLFQKGKCHSLF